MGAEDTGLRLEPKAVEGRFSALSVRVPKEIDTCTGIVVNGHRIRSFAYSTDVAIIHNTNADAILAVYPFTGHPMITQAICQVAKAPVFVGVGGGTTQGVRSAELAMFSEMQGVAGVVVNAPAPIETIEAIVSMVDIPVMATIVKFDEHTHEKIAAGARIINVAAGRNTANVVAQVRAAYPDLPIVATGGPTSKSILSTIDAGANAISWTPPDAQFLQGVMMDDYRAGGMGHAAEERAKAAAVANAEAASVPAETGDEAAFNLADVADAPHVDDPTTTAFVPGGSTLSERISAAVAGAIAAETRAATGQAGSSNNANAQTKTATSAGAEDKSASTKADDTPIQPDGSIFTDEPAAEKVVHEVAAETGQADRDLVAERIEEAREAVAGEIEGVREAARRAFRLHQEARNAIAGDIGDIRGAVRRMRRDEGDHSSDTPNSKDE